jgi:uncharacterized protein DUF4440
MLAVLLLAGGLVPVARAAEPSPADVATAVLERDTAFWKAYNACAVAALPQFFTTDVEFYHDRGGVTLGLEALVASLRDNLCSNPAYHLRREAVAGTVQVFPLKKGDAVYGALLAGEHVFYVTDKGKPEFLDGHARFADLWLLKDGAWKMARILSYDHGPAVKPGK